MGFGILFIGYFAASLMSVNSFGYIFRLVGFAVILIALAKLARYNNAFRIPFAVGTLMAVCALLMSVSGITGLLYDKMLIDNALLSSKTLKDALGITDTVLEFFFSAALAYAIKEIARETEDKELVFGAVRNFVFFCVYYVLMGVAYLPFAFAESYVKYFSLPVLLLYFACIILNLVLIFKCYMRICDENDVDMARKPSRFEFINRLRVKSDEREERAIKKAREYEENKAKKRANKKDRR